MLADWRAHLAEVQRRKDAGEPPFKTIEEYRAQEQASTVSCGANDSEEEKGEEEGEEEVAVVACAQDPSSDDERPQKVPRLIPRDGATKVRAATRTPRPADLPLLVFRIG